MLCTESAKRTRARCTKRYCSLMPASQLKGTRSGKSQRDSTIIWIGLLTLNESSPRYPARCPGPPPTNPHQTILIFPSSPAAHKAVLVSTLMVGFVLKLARRDTVADPCGETCREIGTFDVDAIQLSSLLTDMSTFASVVTCVTMTHARAQAGVNVDRSRARKDEIWKHEESGFDSNDMTHQNTKISPRMYASLTMAFFRLASFMHASSKDVRHVRALHVGLRQIAVEKRSALQNRALKFTPAHLLKADASQVLLKKSLRSNTAPAQVREPSPAWRLPPRTLLPPSCVLAVPKLLSEPEENGICVQST